MYYLPMSIYAQSLLICECNRSKHAKILHKRFSIAYRDKYKAYIKAALPTIPVNYILALVTNEEANKSFNEKSIYI